jgi:hypothetical protein
MTAVKSPSRGGLGQFAFANDTLMAVFRALDAILAFDAVIRQQANDFIITAGIGSMLQTSGEMDALADLIFVQNHDPTSFSALKLAKHARSMSSVASAYPG